MMRTKATSNVDAACMFFQWLKNKGITSHRQAIVQAVCLKCNQMFGGNIYNEAEFVDV
jgi:hypothetical protein